MAGPSRRVAVAIWGAVLASPVVLAGVAVGLSRPPEMPELRGLFLWMAAAVAGLGLLLSRALPPRIGAGAGAPSGTVALSRMVVAWAILEGAALFPSVAYLITGDPWLLLVVGLLLAALAAAFPGEARWVRAGGEPSAAGGPGGPNRMVR
jgi:hypothetical protein